MEALHIMTTNMEQIIQSDPFGKTNSIFYTGSETILRPEIARYHTRLIERYPYRKTHTIVIVPDIGGRPFSDTANIIIDKVRKHKPESTILLFLTPMGVIPWELEHVHPSQQCIFPYSIDDATKRSVREKLVEFLDNTSFMNLVWFDRESPITNIVEDLNLNHRIIRVSSASAVKDAMEDSSQVSEWTLRKLKAVISYQWDSHAGKLIDSRSIQAVLSRSTSKIRYVKSEDDILFTMVPTTGLLTPTYKGGLALLEAGISQDYIVTMDSEVAEFVADGKSALAKFVRKASMNLRAGEEVLVVDEDYKLLGTGRALLNGKEMVEFDRGVAVMIRHSLSH